MPSDPEVTEDRLLGGRVRLFQPRAGYRVSIDPVLLAAAVATAPGDLVLDAGAGSGAAALCLAARAPGCRIIGVECQPALLALAGRSVTANGMAERIELVEGDLAAPPAVLKARNFDHVMTNPPFLEPTHGTASPDPQRRGAAQADLGLAAWIAACLRRLRPGGTLTLIHRADRIDAVLAALAGAAGSVVVFPLWPRADAIAARRVVVRAVKGSHGPALLSRGLVLHDPAGQFTAAAEAVLRHAGALQLEEPPR